MFRFPLSPASQPIIVISRMAFAIALVACSAKQDSPMDSAKPAASGPSDSAGKAASNGMAGMGGMAMTGNPDQDFLRMMSDHHKGLIAMVHETIDRKEPLGVMPIAQKLDTMSTMLETTFKDPYAPKVAPEHQAMADQLKAVSGGAYDRAFLQNVIKHHQEAIPMIDQYLPQAKNAQVKALAQRMKAAQTKEIAEFQKRLAAP